MNFVQVGANLYPDPLDQSKLHDLGNGRQAVPGYSMSFRKNMWNMALQVKNKAGAFYKPIPVMDFLDECFATGRGGGGGRGGGYRGGGGGGRYGGGGSSVRDRTFWDKAKLRQAESFLKGLQVREIFSKFTDNSST